MTNVSVPQDPTNASQVGKRVLAIAGSLRSGSWNRRLLAAAVECAPARMTISVYRDLELIPLFDEDLEHATNGEPDSVRRLRCDIASADGVLIATPEYNQSIPGILKNAIDWLSRATPDEVLAGKPIAIIGASSGRWGTRLAQNALRQTLYATESLIMPTPALFVREAAGLFDDAGRLCDIPTRNSLQAVLDLFANWIDFVAAWKSAIPVSTLSA